MANGFKREQMEFLFSKREGSTGKNSAKKFVDVGNSCTMDDYKLAIISTR
jgi:hypothetical protein